MKATYFVAVFASVAAAASANMNAAASNEVQTNEVYARQADAVTGAAGGAADAVGGAAGEATGGAAGTDNAGATLGSLLGLVEKILGALGEKVPELKETAKKVTDAISDFAEAAKDVDPDSITSKKGE